MKRSVYFRSAEPEGETGRIFMCLKNDVWNMPYGKKTIEIRIIRRTAYIGKWLLAPMRLRLLTFGYNKNIIILVR